MANRKRRPTRRQRRARARRLRVGGATLAAFCAVAAAAALYLTSTPVPTRSLTVLAIDRSMSMAAPRAEGADADVFDLATRLANRRGAVMVDRIGNQSELAWKADIQCDTDSPSKCRGELARYSVEVRAAAGRVLESPARGGSDILASLRSAELYRTTLDHKVDTVQVSMVTDGLHNADFDLLKSLRQGKSVDQLVKMARSGHSLPDDCGGFEVSFYHVIVPNAFGGDHVTPDEAHQVQEFWREALRTCGGRVTAWSPNAV